MRTSLIRSRALAAYSQLHSRPRYKKCAEIRCRQHSSTQDSDAARHVQSVNHRGPRTAPKTFLITEQWHLAAEAAKQADSAEAMRLYISRMDQHFDATQGKLDYRHVSGALYGTARIWQAAQQNRHSDYATRHANQDLQDFLGRMLGWLQLVLSRIGSREASSIFWCFARLAIVPDTLRPGIVDSLAQRFIIDQSNATGQSYASVLLSCADLQLDPCKGELLQAVLQGLAHSDLSKFSNQALANIAYSCAKTPSINPTSQLLDALCQSFYTCMLAHPPYARPKPQAISNFAWALQKLKHAPSPNLAAAMLSRMLELCQQKEQQPTVQAISNFLLACAELRFPTTQAEADLLTYALLSQAKVFAQALSNTAWSLAIMGRLRPATLQQLMHRLQAESRPSLQPQPVVMGQLHQALDWLMLCFGPRDPMLLQLLTDLERLGPRPQMDPEQYGTEALSKALAQLGLQCLQSVVVKGYWINVVVRPQAAGASPILLTCSSEPDGFSNQPARLTGRAVFCHRLLSTEGVLVEVPRIVIQQGTDALAGHLYHSLTAVVGSLDAYR